MRLHEALTEVTHTDSISVLPKSNLPWTSLKTVNTAQFYFIP